MQSQAKLWSMRVMRWGAPQSLKLWCTAVGSNWVRGWRPWRMTVAVLGTYNNRVRSEWHGTEGS